MDDIYGSRTTTRARVAHRLVTPLWDLVEALWPCPVRDMAEGHWGRADRIRTRRRLQTALARIQTVLDGGLSPTRALRMTLRTGEYQPRPWVEV